MKVTLEMLEQYNACPQGIKFIRDNYPDGAEAMEIMNNPNITPEMLHFAARYFPCTSEELKRYQEICNIKNSRHFYFSESLNNCIAVAESKHISDSEYVRQSQYVTQSKNIYGSREVRESQEVLNSFSIKYSDKIVKTKEATHSSQVYNSNLVSWSNNISSSSLVEGCSFVYQSSNVTECYFSGFLKDCRHCLFCSNLSDKEYYVFNQPVTPREYERIREELQYRLGAEVSDFVKVDTGTHDSLKRFDVSARFDAIFDGLSPEFYGWIGTVKGCTEDLFLQIFLVDDNLQNIKNLDIL